MHDTKQVRRVNKEEFRDKLVEIASSDTIILPDTNFMKPRLLIPAPLIAETNGSNFTISDGFNYLAALAFSGAYPDMIDEVIESNNYYLQQLVMFLANDNVRLSEGVYQEMVDWYSGKDVDALGEFLLYRPTKFSSKSTERRARKLGRNDTLRKIGIHESDYLGNLMRILNQESTVPLSDTIAAGQLASKQAGGVRDAGLVLSAYDLALDYEKPVEIISDDAHIMRLYKKAIMVGVEMGLDSSVFLDMVSIREGYNDNARVRFHGYRPQVFEVISNRLEKKSLDIVVEQVA